jgi:hypothetical protein
MTWTEYMTSLGYEVKTTFWEDFSIAERFGANAIKETYERVYNEWKNDVVYWTELVMVLNHKIWEFYEHDQKIAKVYNTLWLTADEYALNTFKGEDLDYFLSTVD